MFVSAVYRDILGLQDIQTDLATLIGEQADDVKLIGMYNYATSRVLGMALQPPTVYY